jgi:hypothetical protein
MTILCKTSGRNGDNLSPLQPPNLGSAISLYEASLPVHADDWSPFILCLFLLPVENRCFFFFCAN